MAHEAVPTLTDVALAAGVSLSTASRVLGDSRDRVSPALRERVMAAARQLDYVPNAQARALAQSTTSMVGLIVHDISDPYFAEIARGVLRVATAHHQLVMICNTFRNPDRDIEYIEALRSHRVAAIVLAGSGYADPHAEHRLTAGLRAYEEAGGRTVLVGRHGLHADAVLPDNIGGARKMVDALVRMGRRRIAVVAGPRSLTAVVDRLEGARQALVRAGLELSAESVEYADFSSAGGYSATHELVERHGDANAIFALNDGMAIGALAALRERGVPVPERISVAGFDDIGIARKVTPALTTVRLPMEQMGATAMELAFQRPAQRPRVRHAGAEVVMRESVSRAPEGR